jgi:hypothetical protein
LEEAIDEDLDTCQPNNAHGPATRIDSVVHSRILEEASTIFIATQARVRPFDRVRVVFRQRLL